MSCLTKRVHMGRWAPVAVVVIPALLAASSVEGQQTRRTPVRITHLSSDVQETPRYSVSRSDAISRGRGLDWFVAQVDYETSRDWLDELSITFYLLVDNPWASDADARARPGGQPAELVLRGRTTYVDVDQGKHKAVMYLQPSTYQRYGTPKAIAVEINTEGQVAATESDPPSRTAWWSQLPSRDGLVVNRLASPWAMLYFDEFEAIKGSTEVR